MTGLLDLSRNKLDHLRFRLDTARLEPADRLLDIGCGDHPTTFPVVTGIHFLADPVLGRGDWEYCVAKLRRYYNNWFKRIDTVALIDVIEHLEKPEALRLLRETEALVPRIIVFTPLGFLPQDDGPFNTHRSGWMPEDFGDGWTVTVYPHYHWCDFKGNVFDHPHGAMLAVYDGREKAA